jgi:hypothetical protein
MGRSQSRQRPMQAARWCRITDAARFRSIMSTRPPSRDDTFGTSRPDGNSRSGIRTPKATPTCSNQGQKSRSHSVSQCPRTATTSRRVAMESYVSTRLNRESSGTTGYGISSPRLCRPALLLESIWEVHDAGLIQGQRPKTRAAKLEPLRLRRK